MDDLPSLQEIVILSSTHYDLLPMQGIQHYRNVAADLRSLLMDLILGQLT